MTGRQSSAGMFSSGWRSSCSSSGRLKTLFSMASGRLPGSSIVRSRWCFSYWTLSAARPASGVSHRDSASAACAGKRSMIHPSMLLWKSSLEPRLMARTGLSQRRRHRLSTAGAAADSTASLRSGSPAVDVCAAPQLTYRTGLAAPGGNRSETSRPTRCCSSSAGSPSKPHLTFSSGCRGGRGHQSCTTQAPRTTPPATAMAWSACSRCVPRTHQPWVTSRSVSSSMPSYHCLLMRRRTAGTPISASVVEEDAVMRGFFLGC